MTSLYDGFNYVVRLEKGEMLVKSLTDFVVKNAIKGAWIVGIGGVKWVEIGLYNLDAQAYDWVKLDELLELTNLTGNVAWQDGKPFLHLHGTFSDASMNARGGHLKEAEIGATCEIFFHMLDGKELMRVPDNTTGLNLLDL